MKRKHQIRSKPKQGAALQPPVAHLKGVNDGPPITIPAGMLDRFEGPAVIGTGEIVPRHALRGQALHRVDIRLTKDISLGSGARLSLIAEVFNLFNHENFGSYVSQVNRSSFGNPLASPLNAYQPRRGQLALHLRF